MDPILASIPLITGIYLLIGALVLKTKNFSSSLIFKVFPFFLGVGSVLTSAKIFGWF